MNIKKHTNYRADLFTGLLGLQILSACVNTRQGLGMDGRRQSEDHNIQECQAGCSTMNDGVPSVSDPMRLTDQHIAYLTANCFSLKSMDVLLAKGLDINARNATKQTLLMCMICGSLPKVRETVFRSIIERGADINAQDENGFTALMMVIFLGDKPLITELLNLNNIDPSLETKLIMPAGKSGRRKRLSLETIIECMQVFVYHFMSLSGKPKLVAKDFTVSDSLYENQESKEIKESFIKDLVARLDEIIDRLKQG